MKIKKLNLISYGKFENKEIDFADGLNIVKGDNGSGKSTIMAFIRAMFYGFDGRGAVSVNDRKHYLPWGKQTLSGSMDILTDDGKNIKISRTSGRSAGNDKKSFMDMSTSEEIDFSPEEELSTKSDAFSKTLFIRQLGSIISGEDSEISAKLINLTNSSCEDIDTRKTTDIITEYIKTFKALRGDKGILSDLEKEINNTNEKLHFAKAKREETFELVLKKRSLSEKADRLKKELEDIRKKLDLSKNDHLFEKLDALSAELSEINEEVSEKENLLKTYENDLEKSAVFEKEPPEEMFTPAIETDSVNKEIDALEKPFTILHIIKSISKYLAIFSFIVGVFIKPVFIATAVFLIMYLSSIIINKIKVSAKMLKLIEELSYREDHNKIISHALSKYGVSDIREYVEKKSLYQALKSDVENTKNTLLSLYEKKENLSAEINELKEKTAGMSATDSAESYDDLMKKNTLISSEMENTIKQIAHIEGVLSKEYSDEESPEILFAKLKNLNAKYEDATKEYQAAQLALDTVNKVFSEMRSDFTPLVNERASKYLSLLTDGELDKIYVDKSFSVTAEKEGVKELSYFSLGTADQTYFAIRLAVTDLLFGTDKPIFIDDAFLQYDKERELNAFKLLKQKADEGQQIIFFTCKDYPEIEGTNIINL